MRDIHRELVKSVVDAQLGSEEAGDLSIGTGWLCDAA